MHRLLKRQLKKYAADLKLNEDIADFIDAVDLAYKQHDKEVSLIERSLELASKELSERNNSLRAEVNKQAVIQDELTHSLAALDATFDATGEAIVAIRADGNVTKYNQMAARLIGVDKLSDGPISLFNFKHIIKNVEDRAKLSHRVKQLKNQPELELFGQLRMLDGRFFEYHTSPQIENNELLGRVWCFRDISELKESEAAVQHQAFHDGLTGLPNRALLDDRLAHAITYCKRFKNQLAILFIDLDDFKKVNDNAGHMAGDKVLIEVSKRIKTCIREVDTLARLGGDEFVVLLENLQDYEVATAISDRIIAEIVKPFLIDDNQFYISSSIGISMYPDDGVEADELMRKADMAMYHAKSKGKNNHQYFDSQIETLSIHQLKIENQLREALANREFFLCYQPKLRLDTCELVGVEALLRWIRPDGTFIGPDEFIPVAEQTGLINEIGVRVLEEVCMDKLKWQAKGFKNIPVAINVSPVEFRNKNLVNQFIRALDNSGLKGSDIEIEITESLFLDSLEFAKNVLNELRALGISVAVDDFGTGYSSLQYLHELPIDILKIDKSFILDLSNEPHNAAIADSIINLAHNLGLKVVAEGIEDQATMSFLKHRGCDIGQGYFLHEPMPKDIFEELFKSYS